MSVSLIQLMKRRSQVSEALRVVETHEEYLDLIATYKDLSAEIRFARAQRKKQAQKAQRTQKAQAA